MIVLDASAAVECLLQTSAGQTIERQAYSTYNFGVMEALRRLALQGVMKNNSCGVYVLQLLQEGVLKRLRFRG